MSNKGLFSEFKEQLRRFGLETTGRHYSFYRGFVADNQDPDFLGRLKVTCPAIYGPGGVSKWAWPRGLPAGRGHGGYAIPAVGDPVYLTFEAGDVNFPAWEYGWYMNGATPEGIKGRPAPDLYLFQTPAGQRVEIDDTAGEITLKNAAGFIIKAGPGGVQVQGPSGVNLGGILQDLAAACARLTVTPTALGTPTAPPNNLAEFTNLVAKIAQLLN